MKKIKLGLIFGGRSDEHEISIQSAKSVFNNLNKKKYEIYCYYITKNGKWYEVKSPSNINIKKKKNNSFISFVNTKPFIRKVDIFFPVLHGPYGEDGTIQGAFELEKIPFVGAGSAGSAVAMDKYFTKKILKANNIPVVNHVSIKKNEIMSGGKKKLIIKIKEIFELPIFVKPSNLGSSVGISKVKTWEKLDKAIKKAFKFSERIIIEQGIEGREIECSVFSNKQETIASELGEIIPYNEFYDYDDKYKLGKTKFRTPAELDKQFTELIKKTAVNSFKCLNLYGMARVDFLIDKSKYYVNELNTIPGFTTISMYPKLWKITGIKYPELLDKLIDSGLERYEKR